MRYLFVCVCVFVQLSGMAQRFSYNQGQAVTSGYYEEIPYEDINGKLIVTVEVKGKPRRFLFDTGAPVMLSDSLVAEVGPEVIHADTVTDVNHNQLLMSVVKIDVKIGKTTFAGIPALKGLEGEIMKCWNLDGIVGSNLLRNSIVSFNAAKRRIIITDQKERLSLSKSNQGRMVTNFDEQSTPMITIGFENRAELQLEFDCGDNAFLRLTEDNVNPLIKRSLTRVVAKGYGASTMGMGGLQTAAQKLRVQFPQTNIGGELFKNATCITNSRGIPGVGTKLLDYGVLTLDYIHSKYYFEPLIPVVEMDTTQWPVNFAMVDGKMVAGVVWDKMADQLKVNEQILAIDGFDCSKIDLCELINNKSMLDGKTTGLIKVRHADGSVGQVTIRKE